MQAGAFFEALETVGDHRRVDDVGRRLQLAARAGAPFRQTHVGTGIGFLIDFVAPVVAIIGHPLQLLDGLVFIV
jgi:hypothetical protein